MPPIDSFVSAERRADISRKVESLIDEMTLEEKVGQLNQLNGSDQTGPAVNDVDLEAEIRAGRVGSMLNVDGIKNRERYQRMAVEESRLGIPLLFGFDVVHGYETIFPIPLGEAASWDPDVARQSASVAATEAAAAGIHWTFAPSADVSRDARWGRAMESSGEDPHLSAEFTAARVQGFQGEELAAEDTVLACAKHFAGYGDVRAGREYNTVDVSEATLREIHLPPFEAAVDAGVGTLMNAFTDVNRIPAGSNAHLVSDILKDEWGFEGFVVSDWNSFRELIYHGVAANERDAAKLAFNAGSDMDMVGHIFTNALTSLVEGGSVPEGELDDSVARILEMKYLLGLFDDPFEYFNDDRRNTTTLTADHRQTARNVARESIVLLKNDNAVLPFSLSDVNEIAVIGSLADSQTDALGEWRARGDPKHAVSILDGIEAAVGAETTVRYASGYKRSGTTTPSLLTEAVDSAADADVAVVTVGETWDLSGECSSRTNIGLPGDQREVLEALIESETPVVAVLMNGRPLAIPWMDTHVPAILETWFLGTEAGHAVADVLFGDHNPSGKLPMSFPRTVGQVPIQYNHLPTGRPARHSEPGWSTSYIDAPNDPLYAFGHGCSYTSFAYSDFTLDRTVIGMEGTLPVRITIENTGEVPGSEVVQLYTRDLVGSRSRPVKELKRFEKILLNPGEEQVVEFTLEADDLQYWTIDNEFAVEPGEFELLVGRAADDIRATDRFIVTN